MSGGYGGDCERDAIPVADSGACNCCGDAALLEEIERLIKRIRELESLIRKVEDDLENACHPEYTSCDGRGIARNAHLATCADLTRLKNDVRDELEANKIRLRNCRGQFIANDATVVDCAEFNDLSNRVQQNRNDIDELIRRVDGLYQTVKELQNKLNTPPYLSDITEKIDGILKRLKELEDCCDGQGNDGDCNFDGWAAASRMKNHGRHGDTDVDAEFIVAGPPGKLFSVIFEYSEYRNIQAVTDGSGTFRWTDSVQGGNTRPVFRVIHCDRTVVTTRVGEM